MRFSALKLIYAPSLNKWEKFKTFRENTQKFQFAVQIEVFKKYFFIYHPYFRPCNSTHTYANMKMLPQKLKLIVFSSRERFWGP